MRLHEKGGKEHDVPCHHNLERYLDEYIAAAASRRTRTRPLFQTAAGRTGRLTGKPLWQQDAYRMIQRRAKAPASQTRIGNHTFRATGITTYLKNSGSSSSSRASSAVSTGVLPFLTTDGWDESAPPKKWGVALVLIYPCGKAWNSPPFPSRFIVSDRSSPSRVRFAASRPGRLRADPKDALLTRGKGGCGFGPCGRAERGRKW